VEEFPLLERLLQKHQGRGFAVLSINIEPEDGASALELMRVNKYTFMALAVPDLAWRDRYGVRSAPANFLLDRAGRLVLQPTFDTAAARAVAEREIEALIVRR